MKALFFLGLLLSCQAQHKLPMERFLPRPISDSSCLSDPNAFEAAFETAYCALSDGQNIQVGDSSEITACGKRYKVTCEKGGKIQGLPADCRKICPNPYFTIPMGTLGQCQSALKTSSCKEANPEQYLSCTVINVEGKNIVRWSEFFPAPSEAVTIPREKIVILDKSFLRLKELRIEGTLVFDERDITIKADSIFVLGNFRIGSLASMYSHQAKIILKKGLFLQGGNLQFFGERVDADDRQKASGSTHWGLPVYRNINFILEKE